MMGVCALAGVMLIMSLLQIPIVQCQSESYHPKFETSMMQDEGKKENGRVQLENLERLMAKSKLPRVGACWKDALEDLRIGCSGLDDETQARLALGFTSCFSEMVGAKNLICDKSNPIKQCLNGLDSSTMDTFRQYFLHTQDMCYFLQSEIWHLETERAVNELQNAAVEMSKTVSEQKSVADSILQSQHTSQKVQNEMLRENYQMFEKVIHIKSSLDEFGAQAQEHRIIFIEIFEKLRKMQELVVWIQGEMSMIDLVTFYAGGVIFAYFLTASERTQRGRVWMILDLAMGLAGERYLYSILGENDMKPEEILEVIHYYRRFIVLIGLLIFLFHAARYRDFQAINNDLLNDMNQRLNMMAGLIEAHFKNGAQLDVPFQDRPLFQILPQECDEDDEEYNSTEQDDETSGNESEQEQIQGEFSDDSFSEEGDDQPPPRLHRPDSEDYEAVPPGRRPNLVANGNGIPNNTSPYYFRNRNEIHSPNRYDSSNDLSQGAVGGSGGRASARASRGGYYSSDDDI